MCSQVASWFFQNVSTFLLANENEVREALVKAQRPSPKTSPLKDYFPPFIFDKAVPDPLPLDADDHMSAAFRRAGETAATVFAAVRSTMDTIMDTDETGTQGFSSGT